MRRHWRPKGILVAVWPLIGHHGNKQGEGLKVAVLQTGRRGVIRNWEGEKALAMSYIRRRVSVAAV